MARAWFSYVVFAMGLMLLFASDRQSIAETKEVVVDNITQLGDAKDIQIFLNKTGDENARVDILINGQKHSFALPQLVSGETQTFTTDDGQDVIVKAYDAGKIVSINGEEIKLPSLHSQKDFGKEGLSSVITRVHEISDFSKNSVTINGNDLPDDVVKAMVDAVQGVLTSYGLDREVMYHKAPKFEFIQADGNTIELKGKHFNIMPNGKNVDIQIETSGSATAVDNIVLLEQKVITTEEQK